MGLRINTNIASLNAQRHLTVVTRRLYDNYSRLSSGLRIATAADDAAGLAISERMRAQVRSYTVAARNAQDGNSLAQTAEGSMNELSNVLIRMRELAMQAANGTLSTEDRLTLDGEFAAMIEEVDRVAAQTEFNGLSLLDGSNPTIDIQIGIESGQTITITLPDASSATLGIDALDVTSVANANTALGALDSAMGVINTARGGLGASQNRIQSALASILNVRENLSAAESRIRDVDVATETADLTRNSIMQQAATAILQQANVQPQIALALLQG